MNRFGRNNGGPRRREGADGAFGRNGRAPERRPAPRAKSLAEIKDEKFGFIAGLLRDACEAHRASQSATDAKTRAGAEQVRDEQTEKASKALQASCLAGADSFREQNWFLQYLGDLIVVGDIPLGALVSLGNAMKHITTEKGADTLRRLRWEPAKRYKSLGLVLRVIAELKERDFNVDATRGVRNAVLACHDALAAAADEAADRNEFATKKSFLARREELEAAFPPFFRQENERNVFVERDQRSANEQNLVVESPNGGPKTEPVEEPEPVAAPEQAPMIE